MNCLKCGDTGVKVSGEKCDCGVGLSIILPTSMKIPMQYQGVIFDKSFVREDISKEYSEYMTKLLDDFVDNTIITSMNVLICAPNNSSKTIWAYTLYGRLYAKGVRIPDLMDLMQARSLMLDYYAEDKETAALLNSAPVVIIKLPMDLPNKFTETMSTIIERRVRNNGSTIFMYNGAYKDLEAQDRFMKLKYIIGDGSFNTLLVKSFK